MLEANTTLLTLNIESNLLTGYVIADICRATLKNQTLIDQWQSVLWDREHQREAEGQVCDLFDAQGYAHMVCRSYFEAEPEVNLDPGEKHWQNELAEARSRKYGQDPYDYTHNPMETP